MWVNNALPILAVSDLLNFHFKHRRRNHRDKIKEYTNYGTPRRSISGALSRNSVMDSGVRANCPGV